MYEHYYTAPFEYKTKSNTVTELFDTLQQSIDDLQERLYILETELEIMKDDGK